MDHATSIPTNEAISPSPSTGELPIRPLWLIMLGALFIVLGTGAFVSVATATLVSVYFVALSMVMAGAAEIAMGLRSRLRTRKWTWVLLGILYVSAGLFALFNPVLAAGVLTLLLGAALLGVGILRIFLSFQMRSDSQWWWLTLSAALTALLGVMVLVQWPASSLYVLGVFLSVDLMFAGASWVMIGVAALSAGTPTAASSS